MYRWFVGQKRRARGAAVRQPTQGFAYRPAASVEIQDLLSGGGEMLRKFNVIRKDSIPTLDTKNDEVHLQVLSPISMVDDIEMYLLTFKAGGALTSSPHFPRTEEYLTIIKGEVEVTAGTHTAHLHEGDFINYHCDIDHEIKNIGTEQAVIHMIVRFRKRSLE